MTAEISDPTPNLKPNLEPEQIIENLGYVMLTDDEHRQLQDAFHSGEFAGDEDQRQTALRGLSFDNFYSRISDVNSLFRKNSDPQDPETPVIVQSAMGYFTYIPPDRDDKYSLLGEMYKLAQDAEDIQDTAMVLGLAINAVHPFNDGNGRTSRFVYDELAGSFGRGNGLDPRHTFTETYGRKNINLGYRLPERRILGFVEQRYFGMDFDDPQTPSGVEISGELSKRLKEKPFDIEGLDEARLQTFKTAMLESDSRFLLGTMYKSLSEEGILTDCLLDDGENGQVIDAQKALGMLDAQGLAELIEGYRQTKIEYVRTLCDCIVNPDEYPISVDGAPMTLRSLVVNNTINYLVSRRKFHKPSDSFPQA